MEQLLHQLGIEPPVILVNIIGFMILLVLLRRYFFGPIRQFLAQRQQQVSEEWQNAQQASTQAEQKLGELDEGSEQLMATARQEAQQAKAEIQQEAQRMIDEAHQRARERERRAEETITRQTDQALAEARDQLAGLSAEVAQQVLRGSLDEERHQALLDAAIADIERMTQEQPE